MTPEQIAEPLSREEEAQVRLRARHSIIWGPGTEASDPIVNDRLWQAAQDRQRLLATLDAARDAEGVYRNFIERVRTSKGEAEAKDYGQLLRWAIHEVQFDRERAALRAALTEQEARDA